MGIAEDDIQKVRSAVTLSDIVAPYSQLRRTGRTQVGLCPFHSERTASFNVNDETIKTTIGQLNFVRWCIQNNIIEHALKEVETKKTNAKTPDAIHTTDATEDPRGSGSGEVCQPLEISG